MYSSPEQHAYERHQRMLNLAEQQRHVLWLKRLSRAKRQAERAERQLSRSWQEAERRQARVKRIAGRGPA